MVRDEPQANGGVIGKEIVDLLVVFEDDLILFSDKDCTYPNTGNPDVDWSRWYRKTVERSAFQLWGAERHIRSHPERIFIDPHCKIRLPVPMPDPARMRVHRVVVAHGASQRCREAQGGSGSLLLVPRIVGDAHVLPEDQGGIRFGIGAICQTKPFIHVLNDESLSLLLRNLDTVSDFVAYLRKKESFISGGGLDWAAGEEALLGSYVGTVNASNEHDFVFPTASGEPPRVLNDRRWHDFLESGERRRKLQADEVSYLWDSTIERFFHHFMAGTSDHIHDGPSAEANLETVLRFFARENRTRRRLLAESLLSMNRVTSPKMRRIRVVPPMGPGDPHWLLLLFPFAHELAQRVSYEKYRTMRRGFLLACVKAVKVNFPDALDIVGFATESGRREHGSEDAVYLDARGWTQADDQEARHLQRKFQILVRPTMIRTQVAEYPSAG